MNEFEFSMPDVISRREPVGDVLSVMFGSPHTGRIYPMDFGHDCSRSKILWSGCVYVDNAAMLYDFAAI